MARIGFVILHYNVIEETIKCIESIQKLQGYENCFIVIVDNASPNNTGVILKNKYGNDKQIHVILKDQNDGFSRGNNAGCVYAISHWNPDFLVVANNDIVFGQKDFLYRIVKEYQDSRYSVLGPDIYNPIRKNHQSPIALNTPTKCEVNRSIILNSIVLSVYSLVYPFMEKYYRNIENDINAVGYDEYKESVCLHGACMIYSRDYLAEREKIFEPETDFYYEEFLQALWCKHHDKKMIYQPEIQVNHMQGKATSSTTVGQKERILFRTRNILKSAIIYKKYLNELEKVKTEGHR